MRIIILMLLGFLAFASPAYAQEQPQTGLIFLDEATYRSIPLAATPLMGELPAEYDLADRFPTPGNQGRQGSCVGWAVAYALKSYQEQNERQWGYASREHLFSPSYVYNQIRRSPDCLGGTSFSDALNLLRREGVARMSDFDYRENDCFAVPSAIVRQNARNFAIADWRRVNVQDETEIKTQIAAGFPVLIGFMADQRFADLRAGQTYDAPGGRALGGHAIVVVGYSDARNAFKVINSWGQDWGDSGFGWMSYNAFRSVVREGYVVQDIVAQQPGPAPVPTPGPSPTPGPAPMPTTPALTVAVAQILHNQPVPSSIGPQPGMQIRIQGRVTNGQGRLFHLVARFSFAGGVPLMANPAESVFRDFSGLVATGTMPTAVGSNDEDLGQIVVTIPYYALNFQPTNGMATHNLSVSVIGYINNQPMAQTAAIPFILRW